ncbi:hypothetical protein CEUSTIGMA_g12057.t1 [Chlamydomonas eustigma]|uniref:3CxxC-type domain-containing protein n=1 Tax=Chlamydomonas eustigma TaxID=1157962 RepID=A0A250XNP6_9CHLO|nr:hypothetical protein CEUSTIGMA_g12057.t1 [Chlamydomonas eustigma]|eukprot:GAX84636.1 hypothetical protein CEUSTIGMA_g12057.t1 [Chlamydomonas eustigma]
MRHNKLIPKAGIDIDKLDPPLESAEGYWVQRKDFEGRKSFGVFQCAQCSRRWYSAHAFKEYKQGCQRCDRYYLPIAMWVNTGDRDSDDDDNGFGDDEKDDAGPHDSERCEACKAGVCKAGGFAIY